MARNFYPDACHADPCALCALRYPNAIVTMDGTFCIRGLADRISDKVRMRSLFRIGVGSARCKDVVGIYYRLRIKGADTDIWMSAQAKTSSATSRCASKIGSTCMRVLRGSFRMGTVSASFPKRKTAGWSFPRQSRLFPRMPRSSGEGRHRARSWNAGEPRFGAWD